VKFSEVHLAQTHVCSLAAQCIADAATLSSVAGTRARFLSLDSSATHLALGASTGRRVRPLHASHRST
jgi:hypothetical protein